MYNFELGGSKYEITTMLSHTSLQSCKLFQEEFSYLDLEGGKGATVVQYITVSGAQN